MLDLQHRHRLLADLKPSDKIDHIRTSCKETRHANLYQKIKFLTI